MEATGKYILKKIVRERSVAVTIDARPSPPTLDRRHHAHHAQCLEVHDV